MTAPKRELRALGEADHRTITLRSSEIEESPTNPRKHLGDVSDLAQSIRAHGILQPLVARKKEGRVELIFGHRRLRAAREAGLREVPVILREMSDAEVLEAQLIENSQREDIHPMEEAEGYERLQKDFGHSVEDLAGRVGKSSASIYASLKLLDLSPPVRKVFYAGKLQPSVALLIARLRDERLQLQAAEEVTKPNRLGEPMSVRTAMDHLQRKYPLKPRGKKAQRLKAKHDQKSEDLTVAKRTVEKIVAKSVQTIERRRELEPSDLRLMLLALLAEGAPATVFQRRGVELEALRAAVAKRMPSPELRGLLLELCVARWVGDGSAVTDEAKALARAFGLNVREIESGVRFELEREAQQAEADQLFRRDK